MDKKDLRNVIVLLPLGIMVIGISLMSQAYTSMCEVGDQDKVFVCTKYNIAEFAERNISCVKIGYYSDGFFDMPEDHYACEGYGTIRLECVDGTYGFDNRTSRC